MQLPVNLLVANVNTTTNATINTTNSGTLVAAPGAGQRLRLWALAFGALPANTGALWLRALNGASFYVELNAVAKGSASIGLPGGLLWPDNTAITYNNRSEVATQAINMLAYYTTELD